jgi:hypothetical protein
METHNTTTTQQTLMLAKREAERMVDQAQRHMLFGCNNPNHDTDCKRYLDFFLDEVAKITREIEVTQ